MDPAFYSGTRCPNGEFRLCCLYSPLRPSLSLLSPSLSTLSSPPSLPSLFFLFLFLSHSLLYPVHESPHPFSLFSFYCFCRFSAFGVWLAGLIACEVPVFISL